MIDFDEVCKRLILHEGLRLKPYYCKNGFLSIGVGRNLIANPLTEKEKKAVGDWQHGITNNAAMMLLRTDICRCIKLCRDNLPVWKQLDPERKYALIDMCFNLGISGLLKFKKMLQDMEIGNYRGAAKECLNSKYAKDVGKRAERIAKLIETGEFDYD